MKPGLSAVLFLTGLVITFSSPSFSQDSNSLNIHGRLELVDKTQTQLPLKLLTWPFMSFMVFMSFGPRRIVPETSRCRMCSPDDIS